MLFAQSLPLSPRAREALPIPKKDWVVFWPQLLVPLPPEYEQSTTFPGHHWFRVPTSMDVPRPSNSTANKTCVNFCNLWISVLLSTSPCCKTLRSTENVVYLLSLLLADRPPKLWAFYSKLHILRHWPDTRLLAGLPLLLRNHCLSLFSGPPQ